MSGLIGSVSGSKCLTDVLDLLRCVTGAHTAAQQSAAIGCGRRQHQVDVYAVLHQSVPDGQGFFFVFLPDGDNGTGLRPQRKTQILQLLIKHVGIVPEAAAQLRPRAQNI